MTELLMYNQQNEKKKLNKIAYLAPNGLISHGKMENYVPGSHSW